MKVKNIIDEDFVNYKKPSMFIGFPRCSFKCDKECGEKVCQNSILSLSKDIEIDIINLVERYKNNNITKAIVCGGLEPFDTFEDLVALILELRKETKDDIIVFSGYNECEIKTQIEELKKYPNIIIKFGRFVPNKTSHYDDLLGIKLASPNQYSRRIS